MWRMNNGPTRGHEIRPLSSHTIAGLSRPCGETRCPRAGSRMGAKRDLTMIELFMVLVIIAILMSLLLPAVQNVRESARSVQCDNRLRQIGLAGANFHNKFRYLPSNGWGLRWSGDPDRGYGPSQPGGWVYQIANDLEMTLGQGPPANATAGADAAVLRRTEIAVSPFATVRCPSRPSPTLGAASVAVHPANYQWRQLVPKTDFAINGGTKRIENIYGPADYEQAKNDARVWIDTSDITGVSFQRSRIRYADITDGITHTYFVGEKQVFRDTYNRLHAPGYDKTCYSGDSRDVTRWAKYGPVSDQWGTMGLEFGSAHANHWSAVFCDGSVRRMTYTISFEAHYKNGNRHDAGKVDYSDPFG